VRVEGRSSINPLEEIIALTSIIQKMTANSCGDSAFLNFIKDLLRSRRRNRSPITTGGS
jgi:hypothetical protein